MNLKRATEGFLFSFIFLAFFAYMILGTQDFFKGFQQDLGSGDLSANVSVAVDNFIVGDIKEMPVTTTAIQPVVDLNVNAESAISVETDLVGSDKIFFEKNSSAKLPIASLTKLMTAVVVLDNYNLSDSITIDDVADSQAAMPEDVKLGATMPIESLLDIMLVASSNKSAYALAEGSNGFTGEQKFVALMNKKARDLGLQDTVFVDPTGLNSGDISTSRDLVKLAKYILGHYPKISDISKSKNFYVPNFGNVVNTDQLLGDIPDVVCSKTGFTDAAKGCLLLVMNNQKGNDYLVNIILGADDRFSEMKKMITWQGAMCVNSQNK